MAPWSLEYAPMPEFRVRVWAIICISISVAAELAGFALIVVESGESRRSLREWQAANPNRNPDGSYGQQLVLNSVINGMLGSTPRRITAAGFILLGIVFGALADFASLPS